MVPLAQWLPLVLCSSVQVEVDATGSSVSAVIRWDQWSLLDQWSRSQPQPLPLLCVQTAASLVFSPECVVDGLCVWQMDAMHDD